MFGLKNSTDRSVDRLLEEKLYEQVAQELNDGKRREGIWAKAIANSNGSDDKAKSLYIKYHVQAIKDESIVTSKLYEEQQKLSTEDEILKAQSIESERLRKLKVQERISNQTEEEKEYLNRKEPDSFPTFVLVTIMLVVFAIVK